MKFGFLSHPKNTRLQQNGSIPNSTATIQSEHYQKADRRALSESPVGSGLRAVQVPGDPSRRMGESGAAADLFSKRTALLPPYTTGIVRSRSNLDIKLGG